MLGAIDRHAKTFSLFHLPCGRHALTPLCDVLSAYLVMGRGKGRLPGQRARLAMSVRGQSRHSQLDHVKPRHWAEEARRSGVPGRVAGMVRLARAVQGAAR